MKSRRLTSITVLAVAIVSVVSALNIHAVASPQVADVAKLRVTQLVKTQSGTVESTATAIDSDDNLYVVGRFSGTVDLGTGSLSSEGRTTAFIAKYTAGNTCLWIRLIRGTGDSSIGGITVNSDGSLSITGNASLPVDFEGVKSAAANASGMVIVLAKYRTDGSLVWANLIGTKFEHLEGGEVSRH